MMFNYGTDLLKEKKVDFNRIEVKKLGIPFEDKTLYDILVEARDANMFEKPDERCKGLAKKIKALVDETLLYADWLTNSRVRDKKPFVNLYPKYLNKL